MPHKKLAEITEDVLQRNLHLLGELYSEDVAFTDPLHEVHGLSDLRKYFAELYANVRDLQFVRGGEGEILIDITLRIDDRRGVRRLVADEIGGVRQAIQIKLLQDHRVAPVT